MGVERMNMLLSKSKRLRQVALVIQTVNIVALKALFERPSQGRAMFNRYYHMYAALKGAGVAWPVKSIFEAFPEAQDVSIVLEHKPGGGIVADVKELCYLAMITRVLAPKRVFEIGTYHGRTALNFALNSPVDCEVLTLDLPPDAQATLVHRTDKQVAMSRVNHVGYDFRNHPASSKIRQLWGDSMTFDFSPFAGTVDLVFVDGAHHYEAVLSDTQNALKLLSNSGTAVIIWHDFGNFGDYFDVVRAILDSEVGSSVFQLEDTQLAVYLRKDRGL
jgi:predicted O-methyltransferase YrrM